MLRGIGMLHIAGRLPLEEVERNIAMYRDLNLNFIHPISRHNADMDHFEQCLNLMHQYGMHAIVEIGGPSDQSIRGVAGYRDKPLRDDWWLRHLPFKNHPAIIGWNMCDDTFDRYYPFLERTLKIIKRYDPINIITATMMDPRHPERLPEGAFKKWINLLDYPITYLYPLQRDSIYGGITIKGGLEDLQRLIANTQNIWKKPVYIQIWCQAHMQGGSYGRVGLDSGETFLPSPEQQRLMTYYILQSADAESSILMPDLFLTRVLEWADAMKSELSGTNWSRLKPLLQVEKDYHCKLIRKA